MTLDMCVGAGGASPVCHVPCFLGFASCSFGENGSQVGVLLKESDKSEYHEL